MSFFSLCDFLSDRCSCPFSLPTSGTGQNEFKLIELYNYPFIFPFIFLPCIKSVFLLCIISPLRLSSLYFNYPRLYLSLSCFSYLLIPPTYNKPNDFLVSSSPLSSTRFMSIRTGRQFLPSIKKQNRINSIPPRLPHLSFSFPSLFLYGFPQCCVGALLRSIFSGINIVL